MEYKKDTRTKNLTLRDIHVGDWVQVWSETTERYSPPLKIIQICDDGTIYLVTSDEERCTPWEEDIKNVDALPITPELLKGFGCKVIGKRHPLNECNVFLNKKKICELVKFEKHSEINTAWGVFNYFHDFQEYLEARKIKLEWKGVEK